MVISHKLFLKNFTCFSAFSELINFGDAVEFFALFSEVVTLLQKLVGGFHFLHTSKLGIELFVLTPSEKLKVHIRIVSETVVNVVIAYRCA